MKSRAITSSGRTHQSLACVTLFLLLTLFSASGPVSAQFVPDISASWGTPQQLANGTYQIPLTLSNTGDGQAFGLTIDVAPLNSVAPLIPDLRALPDTISSVLNPGASVTVTLIYPANVGQAGILLPIAVAGQYFTPLAEQGDFSINGTVTLPSPLTFGGVTLFTDNRPTDDPILSGYILNIQAYVTDPLGDNDIVSVIAYPDGNEFVPGIPLQLGYGAEGKFNDVHPGVAPPYTGQTGQYLIVATNRQGQSNSFGTHDLNDPLKLDFPTELATSDDTTTPTFRFIIPPGSDAVGINIIDPTLLYSEWQSAYFTINPPPYYVNPPPFFPGGTPASFQIPAGILTPGKPVLLRAEAYGNNYLDPIVVGEDILANRSLAYLRFTPRQVEPHRITNLTPAQATVGSSPFTLIVTGNNFTPGAQILWNGSPVPTTFVSINQLTAPISAAHLADSGSPTVTVRYADGNVSNKLIFIIGAAPPQITIIVHPTSNSPMEGMSLIVIVQNSGGPINNVTITRAILNPGDQTTTTPLPILNVLGSAPVLQFGWLPDFTTATLTVVGTYDGGTFSASTRFQVP